MKRFGLVLAVLCPQVGLAQQLPESFRGLSTLDLRGGYLHYNEALTQVIMEKADDYWESTRAVRTKIHADDALEYTVDFNLGGSGDPTFVIYKNTGNELVRIAEIMADELIVPANGFLYSAGRMNEEYNRKRKFRIDGDDLVEIRQPYYFVGLESHTNHPVTLYADTMLTGVVGGLPADAEVTVVLNTGRFFLLKTSFGLVGWTKIRSIACNMANPPGSERPRTIIEGLCFEGD
jgi:hypothetical protein